MAKGLVTCWIQRADFSASDREAANEEEAIRAFQNHDWPGELRLQTELEASGRESCPPGIGFVAPEGAILHVCPMPGGAAMVHFHPTRTRQFFGLVAAKPRVHTEHGVGGPEVVELIHWFFMGQHDRILRRLAEQPRR